MNTNGKGESVSVTTPWIGTMLNRSWYEAPEYARYRSPGDTKVVFWLSPDSYYAEVAWYRLTEATGYLVW